VSNEIKAEAERHKPFADLLHELGKAEGQLLGTLGGHGMTIVDPMGEKFDPNLHEATFEMVFPGKEVGTIFHVESKGYMLNGRVLRPAKVGIVADAR
jgi:molecular chaperone GrpE